MTEDFTGLRVLDLRGGDDDARRRWRELCERSFGLDGEADQAARAIVSGEASSCSVSSPRDLLMSQF